MKILMCFVFAIFALSTCFGDGTKPKALKSKAGNCPPQTPGKEMGTCVIDPKAKTCGGDDYKCPENQKCCKDGCNSVCTEPESGTKIVKPGKCPSSSAITTCVFDSAKNCLDDGVCAGTSKCCPDGCNRACVAPVDA